jgi:hypothetical protein
MHLLLVVCDYYWDMLITISRVVTTSTTATLTIQIDPESGDVVPPTEESDTAEGASLESSLQLAPEPPPQLTPEPPLDLADADDGLRQWAMVVTSLSRLIAAMLALASYLPQVVAAIYQIAEILAQVL